MQTLAEPAIFPSKQPTSCLRELQKESDSATAAVLRDKFSGS